MTSLICLKEQIEDLTKFHQIEILKILIIGSAKPLEKVSPARSTNVDFCTSGWNDPFLMKM